MPPGSDGSLFLMRQTGLTAGNLPSHTSKLEAVGYTRGRGRDAFQEYREGMMRMLL